MKQNAISPMHLLCEQPPSTCLEKMAGDHALGNVRAGLGNTVWNILFDPSSSVTNLRICDACRHPRGAPHSDYNPVSRFITH
jgi:hypothetical protein